MAVRDLEDNAPPPPRVRAFNDNISLPDTEPGFLGSTPASQPGSPGGSPRGAPSRDGSEADLPGVHFMSSPGNMALTRRVAYAFTENLDSDEALAPFIREALSEGAPDSTFRLFPSSVGDYMLVFDSPLDREMAAMASPFHLNGGRVFLVRSELAPYRFRRDPEWHIAISVTRFPPEHWNADEIREALRSIGDVLEIDSDCLDGDFSSVRAVVARHSLNGVPNEIPLVNPDGLGAVPRVSIYRCWPRALQLDAVGRYRPFYRSNRGPPVGDGQRGIGPPGFPNGAGNGAPRNGGREANGSAAGSDSSTLLGHPVAHLLRRLLSTPPRCFPLPPLPRLPLVIRRLDPCLLVLAPEPSAQLSDAKDAKERSPNTTPLICYQRRPKTTTILPDHAAKLPVLAASQRASPPKRTSARLARLDPGTFLDSTAKAVARKALRDSLSSCSAELKNQVRHSRVLKKKNALKILDLTRLGKAAGLDEPSTRAVARAAASGVFP